MGLKDGDPRSPQLPIGVYGNESIGIAGPFGLRYEQMRDTQVVVRNAGWFNKRGERLGFGDLSRGDLVGISEGLNQNELFVVLNDDDSYRSFTRGEVPWDKFQIPGIEYIVDHFEVMVQKGLVLIPEGHQINENEGLNIRNVSRAEAAEIIAGIEYPKPTS